MGVLFTLRAATGISTALYHLPRRPAMPGMTSRWRCWGPSRVRSTASASGGSQAAQGMVRQGPLLSVHPTFDTIRHARFDIADAPFGTVRLLG
jgi:hypothetical protein